MVHDLLRESIDVSLRTAERAVVPYPRVYAAVILRGFLRWAPWSPRLTGWRRLPLTAIRVQLGSLPDEAAGKQMTTRGVRVPHRARGVARTSGPSSWLQDRPVPAFTQHSDRPTFIADDLVSPVATRLIAVHHQSALRFTMEKLEAHADVSAAL